MSEASNPSKELTRRNFLKLAGAATGAAGLAGAAGMTSTEGWLAPAGAFAESEERIAYTFHQMHCAGHCSFKCSVRDGRLCKIEPNNAWKEDRYATCCLKGLSEIQHVYSSERIQTPLKRVGERGSGEFVSITWDEALSTISEKIGGLQKDFGKDSVVLGMTVEVKSRYPHLQKILGAQNDGQTGIDVGLANGYGPMFGLNGTGISTSEARDWTRTKTLIMVGTNFLETSLTTAKCFFEAKEAGCDIVVIDPCFTITASKANQWIPIEPGTDAALFLGMTSCVLENGWYDEASMKETTSFPFLVDVETGAMLRQKPVESKKETAVDNPFMVWCEDAQALLPAQEAASPALEGAFDIDGKSYTTVFELLKRSQEEYTLAWAAEKTGIAEDVIFDLTKRYACNTPATLSLGWGGGDKYANADIAGHAAGILAALTGNYGKPGASIGCHIGGALNGWSAKLAAWELPKEMVAAKSEMPSYNMRYQENNVKAYIAVGDMFQQHYANMNVTAEWLKSLDFIVCVDMYHTTSADWADIVLPACTKFETTEEVEALKVAYGHVLAQQKVIEPLFESKTDFAIEHALAECLGVSDVLPASAMEFCAYQLEKSKDKKLAGMTLDALSENQGILPLPGIEEIKEGFAGAIAKTPTGRVNAYFEEMLPANQQLPVYEDANEAYEGNELREKYPLQFSQVRTKFHIHSMFCDASWIQQFYEPYIELNPIDMEQRGLNRDDMVQVFNDRGTFSCRVRANAMVRPRTARMYEGMWSKFMPEGNIQNLSNDAMPERSPLLVRESAIPFNDTLVEVKKA